MKRKEVFNHLERAELLSAICFKKQYGELATYQSQYIVQQLRATDLIEIYHQGRF